MEPTAIVSNLEDESRSREISNQLNRFENYLRLLAACEIDPALRGKVDISGVVQQTLLEAYQDMGEIAHCNAPIQLAWLSKTFTRNLSDEIKKYRAAKRDVYRERSLE